MRVGAGVAHTGHGTVTVPHYEAPGTPHSILQIVGGGVGTDSSGHSSCQQAQPPQTLLPRHGELRTWAGQKQKRTVFQKPQCPAKETASPPDSI